MSFLSSLGQIVLGPAAQEAEQQLTNAFYVLAGLLTAILIVLIAILVFGVAVL